MYNLDPGDPPPIFPNRTGSDYGRIGGFNDAKVDQEIVDFAVSQFSGINEKCFNIKAENFQVAVV